MKGPGHALVREGQPLASVVVPPKPTDVEFLAAEELAAYIERISGATLPVVDAPPADGYPILLGAAGRGRLLR